MWEIPPVSLYILNNKNIGGAFFRINIHYDCYMNTAAPRNTKTNTMPGGTQLLPSPSPLYRIFVRIRDANYTVHTNVHPDELQDYITSLNRDISKFENQQKALQEALNPAIERLLKDGFVSDGVDGNAYIYVHKQAETNNEDKQAETNNGDKQAETSNGDKQGGSPTPVAGTNKNKNKRMFDQIWEEMADVEGFQMRVSEDLKRVKLMKHDEGLSLNQRKAMPFRQVGAGSECSGCFKSIDKTVMYCPDPECSYSLVCATCRDDWYVRRNRCYTCPKSVKRTCS